MYTVKLGGRIYEFDEALPVEEIIRQVTEIKAECWKRGIDPMAQTPEELEEIIRGMKERYASEERNWFFGEPDKMD